MVRRLVNEHGLDPASITGTGPGGRITRDDVLDHIDRSGAKPAAAPAAAAEPAAPAAPAAQEAPAAGAGRPRAGRRPRRRRRPGRDAGGTGSEVTSGERDTTISLSRIRKLTGATW